MAVQEVCHTQVPPALSLAAQALAVTLQSGVGLAQVIGVSSLSLAASRDVMHACIA